MQTFKTKEGNQIRYIGGKKGKILLSKNRPVVIRKRPINKPYKTRYKINPMKLIVKNGTAAKIAYNKALDQVETNYKSALLVPEFANNAKIPGYADPVVSVHRKITFKDVSNTSGNYVAVFSPTLSDNSNSIIGLFTSNNVLYTDVTVPTTLVVKNTFINPFSMPAGTALAYRMVSCGVVARALLPALTSSGDIHMGLVSAISPTFNGAGTASMNAFTALPTIQQEAGGKYIQAHVESRECVRGIWMPKDNSELEFTDINNTISTGLLTNMIVVIFTGLPATAAPLVQVPIEFEFFYNFEVTPAPGSVLAGMEGICSHNETAAGVWRDVRINHPTQLTMSYVNNDCITSLAKSMSIGQNALMRSNPQATALLNRFTRQPQTNNLAELIARTRN